MPCTGVSTGLESGHQGSSSRLPPVSGDHLGEVNFLGYQSLTYKIAGLALCGTYALFPHVLAVIDIFLSAYYVSSVSGSLFPWEGISHLAE